MRACRKLSMMPSLRPHPARSQGAQNEFAFSAEPAVDRCRIYASSIPFD